MTQRWKEKKREKKREIERKSERDNEWNGVFTLSSSLANFLFSSVSRTRSLSYFCLESVSNSSRSLWLWRTRTDTHTHTHTHTHVISKTLSRLDALHYTTYYSVFQ